MACLFRSFLHSTTTSDSPAAPIQLLILGAGWTSTFLIPFCRSECVSYSATTRAGSLDTIPFEFDPTSDDPAPFTILPDAKTVLITFPITLSGASERLINLYTQTRKYSMLDGGEKASVAFIQLGSTGVWDVSLQSFLDSWLMWLQIR